MRYYAVAELDITDPAWVREYVGEVTPMVERHGGRYLARTQRVEAVEGERTPPQIFMLIEWPSPPRPRPRRASRGTPGARR